MELELFAVIGLVVIAGGFLSAQKGWSKQYWVVVGLVLIAFLGWQYGGGWLSSFKGSHFLLLAGICVAGLLGFMAYHNRRTLQSMASGVVAMALVLTLMIGVSVTVAAAMGTAMAPTAPTPTETAVEVTPKPPPRAHLPTECLQKRLVTVTVTEGHLSQDVEMTMDCTRVTLYPENIERYVVYTPPKHCLDWTPDDGTVKYEKVGKYSYGFSAGDQAKTTRTPVTMEVYAVPGGSTYDGFTCPTK